MPESQKLIEVAMPVKEISAESVRDKSIRHGHISTLHLWWARRPLPVCRAVVFASLVPDPLDENCPVQFKEAVEKLLSGPKYKPYDDIPFTAAVDPMPDNLRNRLMMFIGKFSDKFLEAEKSGNKCASKEQLTNDSLIKWESKNNEEIINKARKLIWVSHNTQANGHSESRQSRDEESLISCDQLLTEFEEHYQAIKDAEEDLYNVPNRHIQTEEVKQKEKKLEEAKEAFLDRMPKVFDPFAGGGAIPLEAARLGCRTYANDLNPVAHIIEKGSLEFPQKYGKPISYTDEEFKKIYGEDEYERFVRENDITGEYITIENRLAFDVEYYAKKLIEMTEKEVGHLYPNDEKGNKPIAYYWARVAECSNPSCRAEVPLLKNFYLVNKSSKKVFLRPMINGGKIEFEVQSGKHNLEGWNNRGNLLCPVCNNSTPIEIIKEQSNDGKLNERLLAVIYESNEGKSYRLPTANEIDLTIKFNPGIESFRPSENMQRNSAGGDTFGWGIKKWGQLFTQRQLLVMQTFVKNLALLTKNDKIDNHYKKTIKTYLAILIDRLAVINTSFGRIDTSRETITHPFARQAIPMIFDFPESNPFCGSSGSALNHINWIVKFILGESHNEFTSTTINAASGNTNQFEYKSLTTTITDPPYFDSIAYADLSDFFYLWLKRTVSNIYPENFSTPQTPKTEECTALKHYHDDSADKARYHFEKKLLEIFNVIEQQTNGIVSIMFAHQSNEAWTTLCNSIINANMNITGSWAIDTEMGARMVALGNLALASSVTVACRPSKRSGIGEFKNIKSAIESNIKKEVVTLYRLGFRGADLLTACFGQAVSEFGKYERVEKMDGSEVTVAELLATAREATFQAIVSDINADPYTKFYIGWLNLFGFTETEHDDVRRITQIGLNINVNELQQHHILISNGNKQTLANYKQRNDENSKLGEQPTSFTIDKIHKTLKLLSTSRANLLKYISENAGSPEHIFWRVANSLKEVLPKEIDDYKHVSELLANKDSLLREAKTKIDTTKQEDLFTN